MLALAALALLLLGLEHHSSFARAETLVGYKTEPTFTPEIFKVTRITDDRSRLAPGYLFIDPFVKTWSTGPQIYTIDGELVWYGNATAHWRVQDFKTCDYLGERGNHLCWHEAESRRGHNPLGRKVVFDNSYKQVGRNYTKAGKGTFPNTHEFRMMPGGESFIEPVYQPKSMDLRPYSGPKDGWVFDGCFMEIATRTGEVLFKWCYLENHPVWETQVFLPGPNQTNVSSTGVGAGTYNMPWDFFHMNAVDKNAEGDYLVSSRYFDTIFHIAGPDNAHGLKPGIMIWRLGGTGNDFKKNFTFSRQHNVRFISTESTGTVLSIFANHWDGHTTPTSDRSEGMLIRVDNTTNNMSAHLLQSFPQPFNRFSRAQGSFNLLPNGNGLVGWGTIHACTEYSATAEVLYHAIFERYTYRVIKSQWVGKPYWKPKLMAYSRRCRPSPIHAYVSWNGATEVKNWRFYSAASYKGPWIPLGTFPKNGFETHVELLTTSGMLSKLLSSFTRYVTAQALDSDGNLLGDVVFRTFVPCEKTAIKHDCGLKECSKPLGYEYRCSDSCANVCGRPWLPGAAAAILVFLAIEIVEIMYLRVYLSCKRGASEPDLQIDDDNEEKRLLEAGDA